MGFYSYEGISNDILDKQHTTSNGETYTLRHNENLKVEMQFLGKGNSSTNSQGWERNSSKYFKALYQNHPEMFSKKNVVRIKEGHAPIVDQKMIANNPGWAQYRNQPLIHHHIGGDGVAVAVPKNAHIGHGEIHNHEKAAGITDNCERFSQKCETRPDLIGQTTSKLHAQISSNEVKSGNSVKTVQVKTATPTNTKNTQTPPRKSATQNPNRGDSAVHTREAASAKNQTVQSEVSKSSTERTDSVRKAAATKQSSSSGSRSDSVKKASGSSQSTISSERSNAVRNASSNSQNTGTSRTTFSGGQSNSHSSGSSSGGASRGSSSGGGQSK